MSRYLIMLRSATDRMRVAKLADEAPAGTRVTFNSTKRSLDQNSKLWAMLTDIALQVKWHGVRLRPNDFKLIFLDALKRELRVVPNLDGTGFVNLGRSSSDLSKQEMGDLIELITAWSEDHGIKFKHEEMAA